MSKLFSCNDISPDKDVVPDHLGRLVQVRLAWLTTVGNLVYLNNVFKHQLRLVGLYELEARARL